MRGWRRGLAPLLLAALVAGCASHPALGPETPAETAIRQTVLETALAQIGRPYRYGGADPAGFDCSGLVQYSYAQAGMAVPRTTRELETIGQRIDLDQARPGDLLFYSFSHSESGLHVTLYVGEGRFVHAPSTGGQVSLMQVNAPGWPGHFLGARRLLP